jgi:hypothetical protein
MGPPAVDNFALASLREWNDEFLLGQVIDLKAENIPHVEHWPRSAKEAGETMDADEDDVVAIFMDGAEPHQVEKVHRFCYAKTLKSLKATFSATTSAPETTKRTALLIDSDKSSKKTIRPNGHGNLAALELYEELLKPVSRDVEWHPAHVYLVGLW